jgi:AbrB family looped-hinge helix DNA binding protein
MEAEEIVRVSGKGQIVIPRIVRRKLGIEPGKRLLVATDGGAIFLKKLEDLSLEEISERTTKVLKTKKLDVATLVDEAVTWARKEKQRRSK